MFVFKAFKKSDFVSKKFNIQGIKLRDWNLAQSTFSYVWGHSKNEVNCI